MTQTIGRAELESAMNAQQSLVLLETLPESSYDKGHLPGAVHLAHERVRELAPMLLPDKSAAIVTYCASATCQNSHIAAQTLRAMGYTNVRVYAGGKQDWTEAGLPLESKGT